MEVELNAFSGRPNPRWRLTADEAKEFAARLRKLNEPAGLQGAGAPGLGYRGFVVHAEAGELPDTDTDTVAIYRQPELEAWLLKTAAGQVEEAVVTFVQLQLDSY